MLTVSYSVLDMRSPVFVHHVEIEGNQLETPREVLKEKLLSVVRDLLWNNREKDPSDFYHYQCEYNPDGFFVGGMKPQVNAQGHVSTRIKTVSDIVEIS